MINMCGNSIEVSRTEINDVILQLTGDVYLSSLTLPA